MEEIDSITALARLFRTSSSALRYWDKEGLIRFERNRDNHYRVPTMQTLVTLGEVMLYRSCSIPVKEIRAMPGMDAEELGDTLDRNEARLTAQMEALSEALSQLRSKRELVRTLEELLAGEPRLVTAALPAVVPFSFEDPEHMRYYIGHCDSSVLILPPGQPPRFGMFRPEEGAGPERTYLYGLLRVDAERMEDHNGGELLAAARALGYVPGTITGRYLASPRMGERQYDCYESWVELTRDKEGVST